ncbi:MULTISPECIES: NAD(P)-dependent oxidoreductase [unclassified Saccharothrix]|uniref:NAD(P)-dependent oxidoreductase n=1 Tax=unclassified Saccharothrix TaxID=2593673 RepID=UPI00307ECDC9
MNNELEKQPVTVLGLGLMGSAIAVALRDAGHPTTVWTRSDRPGPEGTTRARSAAQAVAASPVVVVSVLDYRAVEDVLPADLAGKVVLNLTTGTPDQARDLAAEVEKRGGRYLDGGIMTTPPALGTPQAVILCSGPADLYAEQESVLRVLGTATFVGEDPGLAALFDTALLTIMYGAFTGYLQATALVGREGVTAGRFLPMAQEMLGTVASFLPAMADQVDSGDFTSREARLDMQISAAAHLIQATRDRGVDATLLELVKGFIERAVAAGHAGSDFPAVIEVLRKG